MHNSVLYKAMALVMTILIAVSAAGVSLADQDSNAPCTLEVITADDEGNGIDGFKVALYKVASMQASGVYSITTEFEGAGYTIDQFTSGEITDDTCQKLRKYALDNNLTPIGTATTGEDGKTVFDNLECGIYLFINTEREGTAETYYEFIPGVVYAPSHGPNGSWDYTSKAYPKVEKVTEQATPTPPPEDPPPQTGDSSNIELWRTMMYISIAGVFVFGIFTIVCGRKEDEEEEIA